MASSTTSEQHALKNDAQDEFDEKSGFGFDPFKQPHRACPDCDGGGHLRAVLADARHLSPGRLRSTLAQR